MEKIKFSISKRVKSFKHAFDGLQILLKEEHNARIHFLFAICAIVAGFIFEVSVLEWIALIFCISTVFVMEIFNTAIENICDFISLEKHEEIKKIKDLAAAGVLITALASVVVGIIIFLPKVIDCFI